MITCPYCGKSHTKNGKRFSAIGLNDHIAAKHPEKPHPTNRQERYGVSPLPTFPIGKELQIQKYIDDMLLNGAKP